MINAVKFDADRGLRIKETIESSQYTQKKVYELLEISKTHMIEIIKGKSMDVTLLIDICSLLDVDIQFILFGNTHHQTRKTVHDLIDNLSDEQLVQTEVFIKTLIKFNSTGLKLNITPYETSTLD